MNNNFTTKEQSKRLLELGVPAESADCYLIGDDIFIRNSPTELYDNFFSINSYSTPCWSAGALMEILAKCYSFRIELISSNTIPCIYLYTADILANNTINSLILYFHHNIIEMDFSKLNKEEDKEKA